MYKKRDYLSVLFIFLFNLVTSNSFKFTKPFYRTTILRNSELKTYVMASEFRMGIVKPANQSQVYFKLTSPLEITKKLTAESEEIGGFYFLRIRTKALERIVDLKHSFYNITVEAVDKRQRSNEKTSTIVSMNVLDQNNHCPLFINDNYIFNVRNDVRLTTKIGQLKTNDMDKGINSEVFYYIQQPNTQKFPFSINPYNGDIYPLLSLQNYPELSFQTVVHATNRGYTRLGSCEVLSRTKVIINIKQTKQIKLQIIVTQFRHYFHPVINNYRYAKVTIHDQSNRNVTRIYPVNLNTSTPSELLVKLIPTHRSNQYYLTLFTLVKLPTIKSFSCTIQTETLSKPTKKFTKTIFIDLNLLRDITLLTPPKTVTLKLSEMSLVNSIVYLLRPLIAVHDVDSRQFLEFELLNDPNGFYLYNDIKVSKTGVVYIAKSLDAEIFGHLDRTLLVGIKFQINRSNVKPAHIKFNLRILLADSNEFPPVLHGQNSTNYISIKENTRIGSVIHKIQSNDPDVSKTKLNFYLYDQNQLPVKLNRFNSDELIVSELVDAETMPAKFPCSILITDSGFPYPRSTLAHYQLRIIDENEHKPVFMYAYCRIRVFRGLQYGYELRQFKVIDLDRDSAQSINISMISITTTEPCFNIDPRSGRIRLLCSLRSQLADTFKNLTIKLQANDGRHKSDILHIDIDILDRPLDDGQLIEPQCRDNPQYHKIVATKQRNEKLRKSKRIKKIDDNDIKYQDSRKKPLFTSPMSHTKHIREELNLGYTVSEFEVKIKSDLSRYNSHIVFGLESDGNYDNFPFLLEMVGNNSRGPNHKVLLKIADRMDKEVQSQYSITVKACDLGKPQYCAQFAMRILLEDINDHAPRFYESFQNAYVLRENTPAKGRIIQISALDKDEQNSRLKYRLVNHRDQFRLHKRTGWLKLRRQLDREQRDNYKLYITASDDGGVTGLGKWRRLTSTLTLSIRVTDVNDNKPEFSRINYLVRVPRDMPKWSFLFKPDAYDKDVNVGDLSFRMEVMASSCFYCDRQSGSVYLKCDLRNITENRHKLFLVVKDNSPDNTRLEGQANLDVVVVDYNWNIYPPVIKDPIQRIEVKEDVKPGTFIRKFHISDPDQNNKKQDDQRLRFVISTKSNGLRYFQINDKGELYVRSRLDREQNPRMWLYVYVEDFGSVSSESTFSTPNILHRSILQVYIEVLDVNDNWPMPSQGQFQVTIRENITPKTDKETELITLTGNDGDMADSPNGRIRYKLLSGDSEGHFSISNNGILKLVKERKIDLESSRLCKKAVDTYNLKVTISDEGKPERRNNFFVNVKIQDVNDNPPKFVNEGKFFFTVYYTIKQKTILIGKVVANDPDYDDLNSAVKYKLGSITKKLMNGSHIPITDDGLFRLNVSSGLIYMKLKDLNKYNLTKTHQFNLKVDAFDLGDPTLWAKQSADVIITLVSQKPNISRINATNSQNYGLLLVNAKYDNTQWIDRGQCVGYEVITFTVADSSDNNGNYLQVELQDLGQPFAAILHKYEGYSSRKFSLVVASSLQYYSNMIPVKMIVRNPMMFFEVTVKAHIRLYNKIPPIFQNPIDDPIEINVSDNIQIPSVIYHAKLDPTSIQSSTSKVSFLISASNYPKIVEQLFKLDSNTGKLQVISPIKQHYQNQVFEIIIEATNQVSSFKKLIIKINDTNSAPQFISMTTDKNYYDKHIRELISRYSKVIPEIDKTVAKEIISKRSSDAKEILWFSYLSYRAQIDDLVTIVTALDWDLGNNAQLLYSLDRSLESRYFKVEADSGEIRVSRSLKALKNRLIFLPIIVTDKGTPSLSNYAYIALFLRSANESSQLPEFSSLHHEISVHENVAINTPVICLQLQADRNQQYQEANVFQMEFIVIDTVPREAGGLFQVGGDNGCVYSSAEIDREDNTIPTTVTLNLRVQERQSASGTTAYSRKRGTTTVLIHIIDENDNIPRFTCPMSLQGSISESSAPGSLVYNLASPDKPLLVHAIDQDFANNGRLNYIVEYNLATNWYDDSATKDKPNTMTPLFQIEEHTGTVVLLRRLDREGFPGTHVNLRVYVEDKGNPPNRAQGYVAIEINVEDVEDSPPVFEKKFYMENLLLPTYPGAIIAKVQANDPDVISKVTYSLVENNKNNKLSSYFLIDPLSGVLSISHHSNSPPTSQNLPSVFVLVIQASDSIHKSITNITLYTINKTPNDASSDSQWIDIKEMEWVITEGAWSHDLDAPSVMLPRLKPSSSISLFPSQDVEHLEYILLNQYPSISLNSITGKLQLTEPLDREYKSRFTILILIRGWDGRHSYLTVNVTVKDINDYKPTFVEDNYQFQFDTNPKLVHNQTMQIKAIDLDYKENGTLKYSIEYVRPFSNQITFIINQTNGLLTVQEMKNRNLLERSYVLSIKARDMGIPSLFSLVTVTVDMVSDRSPLFDKQLYNVSIGEDAKLNSIITTLKARSNSGHTLYYTIQTGNVDELFQLDFNTGIIRLVDQLDYEKREKYTLRVTATDPKTSLIQSTRVQINVLDRHDEKPEFTKSIFSAEIAENTKIGTEILALGIKKHKYKKVTFKIQDQQGACDTKSSQSIFRIDSSTYKLFLKGEVDYEKCRRYFFIATAMFNNRESQANTVIVKIRILDVNDNKPQFTKSHYNAVMSKRAPIGSLVTIVMATDPDETSESQLRYKIDRDPQQMFSVDPRTGYIRLSSQKGLTKLSKDAKTMITVLVHDTVYLSRANVSIKIIDSSIQPPRFKEDEIFMTCPENTTVNTVINKISAVKTDTKEPVYYRIMGGSNGFFEIDELSGDVFLRKPLKYEIQKSHDIRIAVTDKKGGNGFATLTINVLDINEYRPEFDQTFYEVNLIPDLMSKEQIRRSVLHIKATDRDNNGQFYLHYSFVMNSTQDKQLFIVNLDELTGDVTLQSNWKEILNSSGSYELVNGMIKQKYWIQVCEKTTVHFRSQPVVGFCSKPAALTINILQNSTNYTGIDYCSINQINENNPINKQLGICYKINSGSVTQQGEWSLMPHPLSPVSLPFEIDSGSGYIRTNQVLDFEDHKQYKFSVVYKVSGLSLVSIKPITIDLIDQNDCAPSFDSSRYTITIREDIEIGSKLIQCVAKDADMNGKEQVVYSILPSPFTNMFTINEAGWVMLVENLDYEVNREYQLILSARDTVNHATNVSLFIYVTDVNDQPPFWPLTYKRGDVTLKETCTDTSICSEKYPMVIYHFRVQDNDTETVTFQYVITNQANDSRLSDFVITDEGKLILKKGIDAEETNGSIVLEIMASDGLYWTRDKFILTVTVEDVNDHTPLCLEPIREIAVPENKKSGFVLSQLRAQDQDISDRDNLVYSIQKSSQPHLVRVDPSSGTVSLLVPLNYEHIRTPVKVVISATDKGGHQCLFRVFLRVLDLNDNAPRFTDLSIAPIPEDAPVGAVIGKVHAEDADAGVNKKLQYALVSPTSRHQQQQYFRIDSITGILRVASSLDREKISQHRLQVMARDCIDLTCKFSKTTTATINIQILDVNDSPPVFIRSQSSSRLTMSEDAPIDSFLSTVKAVSADQGKNAEISYRIVQEKESKFKIDRHSGRLFLKQALDYEQTPQHILKIEASDGGTPSLSTTTIINVIVTDVNDNKPEFLQKQFIFDIKENSKPYIIGKIFARDRDSGRNSRITFKLKEWTLNHTLTYQTNFYRGFISDYFYINPRSGEIKSLFQPDFEKQSTFEFKVVVSDQGYPRPLSNQINVKVRIQDINDNAPKFDQRQYFFRLQVDRKGYLPKELIEKGEYEIGHLSVSDKDGPDNRDPFICRATLIPKESSTVRKVKNKMVKSIIDRINTKYQKSTKSCRLYVNENTTMNLGSHLFYLHVNDKANANQISLSTKVPVTIHVIRLSNIPPEIEPLDITHIYYHGAYLINSNTKTNNNDYYDNEASVLTHVLVKDRSPLYDRLIFEFVINKTARANDMFVNQLFSIQRLTGIIKSKQQLDSGDYEMEVKVTNGSLYTTKVISIKVIAITQDMADSSFIIRLYGITSERFLQSNLDQILINSLKRKLSSNLIYLLSMKPTSNNYNKYKVNLQRTKRETSFRQSDNLELLMAIYDEMNNQFFSPPSVVKRLRNQTGKLERELNVRRVEVFIDVCRPSNVCVNGNCTTKIELDSEKTFNTKKVGGRSMSTPQFSYEVQCQCKKHFGGTNCQQPLNKCAHDPCSDERICVPTPTRSPGYRCNCLPFRSGRGCKNFVSNVNEGDCLDEKCVAARAKDPISFSQGGFIKWIVSGRSRRNKRLDLQFSFRLRQSTQDKTLMHIQWNEFRSILVEICSQDKADAGKLCIVAEYKEGSSIIMYKSRSLVTDGAWHTVRLNMVGVYAVDSSYSNGEWWIHVVLDGLRPKLETLQAWMEGDLEQSVIMGAKQMKFGIADKNDEVNLIQNSVSGCFKTIIMNEKNLPYQLIPELRKPSRSRVSKNKRDINLISRNIIYGCASSKIIDSVCGQGICMNGGKCLLATNSMNSQTNKWRNSNNQISTLSAPFVCQCQLPFTGKYCEKFNDPCKYKPCFHNSKCTPTDKSYQCECSKGYYGPQCSIVLSNEQVCTKPLNPCPSHAQCEEHELTNTQTPLPSKMLLENNTTLADVAFATALCRCSSEYFGYRCQHDVNECAIQNRLTYRKSNNDKSSPLKLPEPVCRQGRGICHNLIGGYQCNCSLGFSGRHCELDTVIPIVRDTNSLGLSTDHLYIAIGLVIALFILALLVIVFLIIRLKPASMLNNGQKYRQTPTSTLNHGRIQYQNQRMISGNGSSGGMMSLDPLFPYKDSGSRCSPASSVIGAPSAGYVGGYIVDHHPPTMTAGSMGPPSPHSISTHTSQVRRYSQEAVDRISLCSSNRKEPGGPIHPAAQAAPMQHMVPAHFPNQGRYQKKMPSRSLASGGSSNLYLPGVAPGDPRLAQHRLSTFSLVPYNLVPGPNQPQVHLIPNQIPPSRNSMFMCPTPVIGANPHPALPVPQQRTILYDPHQLQQQQQQVLFQQHLAQQQQQQQRNSNLSLYSPRHGNWEQQLGSPVGSSNATPLDHLELYSNPPSSVLLPHHNNHIIDSDMHSCNMVNGNASVTGGTSAMGDQDQSINSWNGGDTGINGHNKDMISSQEMSLTEATDRSTALLLPQRKQNGNSQKLEQIIQEAKYHQPEQAIYGNELLEEEGVQHQEMENGTLRPIINGQNGDEVHNTIKKSKESEVESEPVDTEEDTNKPLTQPQSSNTVSPTSIQSLPTSSDTKGTAGSSGEILPSHPMKQHSTKFNNGQHENNPKRKLSSLEDTQSPDGTECDETEDFVMDQQQPIIDTKYHGDQRDKSAKRNNIDQIDEHANGADEEEEDIPADVPLLNSLS